MSKSPSLNNEVGAKEHPVEENSSVMMYAGSVPPPQIIEAYEKFMPGAAERFLQMAEKEQQNRIEIDKRYAVLLHLQEENATVNFRWGLLASMIVMVLLFGFMVLCAFLKLEAPLLAALGVPLIGSIGTIVAQFVWRKK